MQYHRYLNESHNTSGPEIGFGYEATAPIITTSGPLQMIGLPLEHFVFCLPWGICWPCILVSW